MNLGSLDGFNRNSLKDFLAEISKVHPRMLFNVDVKGSFSFFETESKYVDTFLAINKENVEFNNRKVSIEASAKRMNDGGGDGERRGGGGGGYKGKSGGFDRERKSGGGSGFGGSKGKFGGHRERKSEGGSGSGDRKRSFGRSDSNGSEKRTFGKSEFKKRY